MSTAGSAPHSSEDLHTAEGSLFVSSSSLDSQQLQRTRLSIDTCPLSPQSLIISSNALDADPMKGPKIKLKTTPPDCFLATTLSFGHSSTSPCHDGQKAPSAPEIFSQFSHRSNKPAPGTSEQRVLEQTGSSPLSESVETKCLQHSAQTQINPLLTIAEVLEPTETDSAEQLESGDNFSHTQMPRAMERTMPTRGGGADAGAPFGSFPLPPVPLRANEEAAAAPPAPSQSQSQANEEAPVRVELDSAAAAAAAAEAPTDDGAQKSWNGSGFAPSAGVPLFTTPRCARKPTHSMQAAHKRAERREMASGTPRSRVCSASPARQPGGLFPGARKVEDTNPVTTRMRVVAAGCLVLAVVGVVWAVRRRAGFAQAPKKSVTRETSASCLIRAKPVVETVKQSTAAVELDKDISMRIVRKIREQVIQRLQERLEDIKTRVKAGRIGDLASNAYLRFIFHFLSTNTSQ